MKLNKITIALLGIGLAGFASADTADDAAQTSAAQAGQSAQTEQAQPAAEPAEQQQALQTVTVRAKAAKAISEATNSYQRDRVNLGLLGRQNAFTTPITVVNYDEKAFADKQPRNMVDAIAQTDASVMAFGGETNTLQGLYVRGLQLDSRQFSVNGLAGMYSAYSSPTAAVGAAQLIKGASSATVGMDPEGAVGAAVNIETKKAPDEGITSVGLGWFGKSRVEPSVDIGHRFGADKQFGIRFNGKFREGDTPRDGFSETNREAALNLDYRGDRFNAALDAMYAKRATRGGRARVQDIQLFGFRLPAAPDGKTNLAPSWQRQTTEDKSLQFTFDYTPSDWVALSGGIGHMESRYYGNFAQIEILDRNGNYRNGAWNNNTRRFAAQGAQPMDFVSRTTSANLKARGFFQTGPVSHNWNAAFDFVRRSRDHDQGTRSLNTVMANNAANTRNGILLNIYNPSLPKSTSSRCTFGGRTYTVSGFCPATTQGADNTYTAPSLALSDTLGFMDDKIRVTLGGRLQWIKQENHAKKVKFSKHRFSPMLMAAWVPSNDFVVYGNYLEDLEPGGTDEDTGDMAPPRVSRQLEFGVRKNWGNIVTTANVYQITRPGYWRNNVYAGSGRSRVTLHKSGDSQGKERNRGIELNAYANLLNKTLRPSIGISYIKADLRGTPNSVDGLAWGTQVSSPRIIAKAGIEWDTPFAKGLTLNAGVQYYGKSYQDTQKTYSFPAYTVVDVGAKYVAKINEKQTLTIRSGVENLFNKKYWQVQRGQYDRSFAVLGMPRTFWIKADYSF